MSTEIIEENVQPQVGATPVPVIGSDAEALDVAPADRAPWTADIFGPSRRLATDVKSGLLGRGFVAANYVAGGDGLDVRSDLGTLNLSDVPTVMVELGNMRNARDAHRMTSKKGRAAYARALASGVSSFLG